MILLLATGAMLTAWLTTRWAIALAVRHGVMDVPNERSSHAVPKPRLGGLAIVMSSLVWAGVATILGESAGRGEWIILAAGVSVAVIGLIDDYSAGISVWARLLVHVGGSCVVVGAVFAGVFEHAWTHVQGLVMAGAVVFIVWMINLTNFIDGIDGIAATQASCVLAGIAVLRYQSGESVPVIPALVAASCLGFLRWNWPPARVFMGDAGSGFLGLMIGAAIAATPIGPSLWAVVVLPAVPVVDATVTLALRAARRERLHVAHRTHAYQWAAQRWGHARVTSASLAVTAGVLFPLALTIAEGWVSGPVAAGLVYGSLALVAVRLGAGRQHSAGETP